MGTTLNSPLYPKIRGSSWRKTALRTGRHLLFVIQSRRAPCVFQTSTISEQMLQEGGG